MSAWAEFFFKSTAVLVSNWNCARKECMSAAARFTRGLIELSSSGSGSISGTSYQLFRSHNTMMHQQTLSLSLSCRASNSLQLLPLSLSLISLRFFSSVVPKNMSVCVCVCNARCRFYPDVDLSRSFFFFCFAILSSCPLLLVYPFGTMTALFLSFFLLLYKTGKGFVGQTAVARTAKLVI